VSILASLVTSITLTPVLVYYFLSGPAGRYEQDTSSFAISRSSVSCPSFPASIPPFGPIDCAYATGISIKANATLPRSAEADSNANDAGLGTGGSLRQAGAAQVVHIGPDEVGIDVRQARAQVGHLEVWLDDNELSHDLLRSIDVT
jgi:hypothetical protein